jgi:hypothetical protein
MALEVADLADIVTATLAQLGKNTLTDLSANRQEYTAFNAMLKRKRMSYTSGKSITVNVQDGYDADRAKFVGLHQTDNYDTEDRLITGSVPWRFLTGNYSFDRREPELNGDASQIIDLIKSRRLSMWTAVYEKFESAFWGVPSGTSDKVTPFGLFYWLVYAATEGFYGVDHANYTAGPAGIDSGTYTRWRNYTGQYTSIIKTDLVRKARKASVYTKFKPPVVLIPSGESGDDCQYYTNYTVLSAFEEILEGQNENLGNDVASKDGVAMFRKRPINHVFELDDNTHYTDPFIGLNWGTFKTVYLRGQELTEGKPHVVAGQHNDVAVDLDISMQWVMNNRRKNFILAKS